MKRLKTAGIINRWRHTHGFGVHSPAAFAFIKTIVRCPYAYYADRDIKSPLARLAHRIVSRADIDFVYLSDDISSEFYEAISLANSHVRFLKKTDFVPERTLAIIGSKPDRQVLYFLSKGKDNIIIMTDAPAAYPDELCRDRSKGFLLRSPHRALLVTSDRMDFVSYDIIL